MVRETAEVSFITKMAATTKGTGKTTKCMEKGVSTIPTVASLMMAAGTWTTSMAKVKSITIPLDVPPLTSTTRYLPINILSKAGRYTKVIFSINKNTARGSWNSETVKSMWDSLQKTWCMGRGDFIVWMGMWFVANGVTATWWTSTEYLIFCWIINGLFSITN